MVSSLKEPLYIFIHIPKTGGTTLVDHLIVKLGEDRVLEVGSFSSDQSVRSLKELKQKINNLSKERKDNLLMLYGHGIYLGIEELFPNREIRYITFLRNPLSRAVSHYNFYRGQLEKGADNKYYKNMVYNQDMVMDFFESFISNNILHNYTFKFLADRIFDTDLADDLKDNYQNKEINREILDKIKTAMEKFYFIGLTENSHQDFLYIYHLLGVNKFFVNSRESIKFFDLKDADNELKNLLKQETQLDEDLYQYAKKLNNDFKKSHSNFNYIIFIIRLKRFIYFLGYYLFSPRLLVYKLSAKMRQKSKTYNQLLNKIKK